MRRAQGRRIGTGRRRTGRHGAWLAVTAVAAALVVAPVQPSVAAVAGGFEVDGDRTTSGSVDWDTAAATVVVDGFVDASGIGGKEGAPAAWVRNDVATPKADIGTVWYRAAIDGDGDQWVYVGLDRASNTGTVYYSVELNQHADTTNAGGVTTPNRSVGDVLVTFTQTGQSAAVEAAARWNGSAWVDEDLDANAFAAAIGMDNFFMEAAVNLSDLGLTPPCTSEGYGALNIRSRNSASYTAEVTDQVRPITVDIEPECGRTAIEKRNESGQLVPGATFRVTPDPASGAGSVTIGDGGPADPDGAANGVVPIVTDHLGDYTVTETVAPPGYLLPADPTRTVTLARRTTAAPVTFVDPLGTALVAKVDSSAGNTPLGGATFTFTKTGSPHAGAVVTVTDNDASDLDSRVGQVLVGGLHTGSWQVRESAAPSGYTLDPAVRTFQVTQDAPDAVLEGAFVDAQDGQLHWVKVGEDGTTRLAGARFLLERLVDDTAVETIEVADGTAPDTDPSVGEFAVDGLLFGRWRITETRAPAGYTPTAPQVVTISGSSPIASSSFVNDEDGRASWRKVDERGAVLAGAAFTLHLGDQAVVVVDNTGQAGYSGRDTDVRAGHFAVGGLDFGTWTVQETTVPSGYAAGTDLTFTVTAPAASVTLPDVVNSQDGRVSWTKVDELGRYLTGAEFSLTTGDQSVVVTDNTGQPAYAGRDTDVRTGRFAVEGLDFGTWALSETVVPLGHRLPGGTLPPVTVSAASPTASFGAVTNHMDGRIAWTKVDEDGAPLAGAGFTLTMGTQQLVVDDYTGSPAYLGIDSDPAPGQFAVAGLDFGGWTLTETTVPTGYAGAAPVGVEVNATATPILLGPVVNTPDGRISWTKVGEGGATLAGAAFTLTLGDQAIPVADNEGQPGYAGRDTDPAAGGFAVAGLGFGDWTLTETTVPDGYTAAAPVEVSVTADDSVVELGDVVNLEDGRVTWTKVDDEGLVLGGAGFTLVLDEQAVEVEDNTGQDGYTGRDTDPDVGEFAVAGLDFGTWTLVETTVPEGYDGAGDLSFELGASADPLDLGTVVNVASTGGGVIVEPPVVVTPPAVVEQPASPSIAFTGVAGVPQLVGLALLLLVVGGTASRAATGRKE